MKNILLLTAIISVFTFAETPAKKSSAAHSNVRGSMAKASKIIWDAWYTVTLSPKTPYGYYNDKVEQIGDKISYKNRFWKSEEGFINEEALASFAEDPSLKPAFFNFHSQYRSTETMIDGTIQNENQMSVSVRQGETSKPPLKRAIPKGTFLSAFFPIWLKENSKSMKVGETKNFNTILEDSIDQDFAPVSGYAKLEAQDEYAKANHAKKLKVNHRGQDSVWYINESGIPLKILMTSQNVIVEKTTQEKAEAFLKAQ